MARGRQSRQEVSVTFVDMETRDRIASYSRNLGDYVENGKPTVTFRHEIPAFLSGVHKTLMQYGFAMGKRYGRGFRRNIRFDDPSLSFCIDICLPGKNKWDTVNYEQALLDCQQRAKEAARDKEEEMSSKGNVSDAFRTAMAEELPKSPGIPPASGSATPLGPGPSTSTRTATAAGQGSTSSMDSELWGTHR